MPRPQLVTLDVWTVSTAAVPHAVWRMAADRRRLARTAGVQFWKLLGTGERFTVGDVTPHRWALLTTWVDAAAVQRFQSSPTITAWNRVARERLQVTMRPLTSRGAWGGAQPFGGTDTESAREHDGPVASITRARLRATRAVSFWRAVPPAARELGGVPGMRCAFGMGEAPVGVQGTFSLWESTAALREFAHRRTAHVEVMRRTPTAGWYAEELFARFAVEDVRGTLDGRRP